MQETDAFFTQTLVGPPVTVMMGRGRSLAVAGKEGLLIELPSGESRLTQMWIDWVLLGPARDSLGHPRVRPGRLRRAMERHALWLAGSGVGALLVTVAYWGVMLWT